MCNKGKKMLIPRIINRFTLHGTWRYSIVFIMACCHALCWAKWIQFERWFKMVKLLNLIALPWRYEYVGSTDKYNCSYSAVRDQLNILASIKESYCPLDGKLCWPCSWIRHCNDGKSSFLLVVTRFTEGDILVWSLKHTSWNFDL